MGWGWRSLPRIYLRATIISPSFRRTSPHRYLFPVGVSALSTVTVEPWTLKGDSGGGPHAGHSSVTISTHRLNNLSVDGLLYFSSATALTLERIDHNFTASSISKNPTILSTLALLANSDVAGIGYTPHSGSAISVKSNE
jgi:hypothetical protein